MPTSVQLKFVDVLGAPLDDHSVIVDVSNLDHSRKFRVEVPLSGQTDVLIHFEDCPTDIYQFALSPTNYRFLQFFLRLTEGTTTVRQQSVIFPVDPSRVIDISAPSFGNLDARLQTLLATGKTPPDGAAYYASLPPILKAAILNFFVKASHTILGDQNSCFDHLQRIVELDRDRVFVHVDAALLEEALQSPLFQDADFSLHKEIPPYRLFKSFKTRDAHGNLQLTFSRNGNTGADYLVDMDIDEAQGIEHIFEVAQNFVEDRLTNPYDVREILIADQQLNPLYGFKFAQKGVAAVAGA